MDMEINNNCCKIENCKNISLYGISYTQIYYCYKHKTKEMKHKSLFCKCNSGSMPIYSINIETKPENCFKCKTDNMINIYSKKCKCGKSLKPIYGLKGSKPECCLNCKDNDMIDVSHKLCECGNRPSFSEPNKKVATHCLKCKTDIMINILKKRALVEKYHHMVMLNLNKELLVLNVKKTI